MQIAALLVRAVIFGMLFYIALLNLRRYFAVKQKKDAVAGKEKFSLTSFFGKFKGVIFFHKRLADLAFLKNLTTGMWIRLGRPMDLTPEDMVLYSEFLSIFFVIVFSISGFKPPAVVISGLAGLLLPFFYFNMQVTARRESIKKDFPDVLDLLTLSVESGQDFRQALAKVIENSQRSAMTAELQNVLQQLHFGRTLRESLTDFANNIQLQDIRSFASVVIQSEELGTSMVEVLRNFSGEMRIRRWQNAEKLAMEAPVKMLIPMVIFIFPGIFIIIFVPIALNIMKQGF